MALLDRVKARVETDLSDSELQAIIDANVAEIERRFGAIAEFSHIAEGDRDVLGQGRLLTIPRPIDTGQPITVVETACDDSETTLDAGDYRVLHGGRSLERLRSGPNARDEWASLVTVTYTPVSDQAERDEVTIALVQLDLSYRGLDKQESAGDYSRAGSVTADAYPAEREALLQRLAPRRGLMVA